MAFCGLKSAAGTADPVGMMCTTRLHRRRLFFAGLIASVAIVASGPAVAQAGDHFHESVECRTCHTLGPGARAERNGACVSCHTPGSTKPWGSAAFHGAEADACTSCHSYHAPQELTLPNVEEPLELASVRTGARDDSPVQCQPCHRNGGIDLGMLTPAHRAAATWYHANLSTVVNQTVSESCLRCHDHDQELPDELAQDWNPPRPHEQASHPYLVGVSSNRRGGFRMRQDIDPRLGLIDGKVECTTCHDIFRHENDMLVAFDTPEGMCLGCHERNAPDSGGGLALAR